MIIGIHGKKRSGKDTIARLLMDKLGFDSYALADPIHRSLHHALSKHLSLSDVKGFTSYNRDISEFSNMRARWIMLKAAEFLNDEYNFLDYLAIQRKILTIDFRPKWSVRNLMQCLGTDVVVNIEHDYWLKRVPLNKNIIVTDIRQQHELDFFREHNAELIFVYRDTNLCDNHVTEQGLIPDMSKDTVIDNNKSLVELNNSIDELIETNKLSVGSNEPIELYDYIELCDSADVPITIETNKSLIELSTSIDTLIHKGFNNATTTRSSKGSD